MNQNNETQGGAIIVADTSYSIMPRNLQAQIQEAVQMRNALTQLFEQLLEPKKDFDRIPGTDKPTLLKPGAEMLCKVFKLAPGKVEILDKETDWERGIFAYTVGMPLIHIDSGNMVAYGTGAANSHEKKYRYRNTKDANGTKTQVENQDPADNINTLVKMASKRAFVDAVLKATGASRMFTQDMEDFGIAQYEQASSKQIGYLQKLFSNTPEQAALAEISGICGREIKRFEDIYRNEASQVIDAKKGGGNYNQPQNSSNQQQGAGYGQSQGGNYSQPPQQHGNAQPDAVLVCADCGAAISTAESNYSTKKHGRALCRKCQTASKAAANTGGNDA